jgi:hypothetical protein
LDDLVHHHGSFHTLSIQDDAKALLLSWRSHGSTLRPSNQGGMIPYRFFLARGSTRGTRLRIVCAFELLDPGYVCCHRPSFLCDEHDARATQRCLSNLQPGPNRHPVRSNVLFLTRRLIDRHMHRGRFCQFEVVCLIARESLPAK